MQSTRAFVTVLASAVLAVGLSACAGGADGSGGGELDHKDSPLSKMLWGGELSKSDEQINSESAAKNKEIEQITAECMTKEGFEYKPASDQSGGVVMLSEDDWKPDDKDWVAKYGYGAVSSPGAGGADGGDEYVDPNQDYLDSLSESERNSYYETLYGQEPTEEEQAAMADGSYEWDWTKSGCSGKAQHEVWGDLGMGGGDDEFSEINEAISKFYDDVSKDPAMAELDGKWATCMDEQGEGGFKAQQDAQASIFDELQKVQESIDPKTAAPEDYGPKNPELKKLQEREIELALVDLDCRTKTNYTQEALKKRFALEEQFIKEHKAELEKYKAFLEQQ